MEKLRVVFMGTPELACASLQKLWSCPGFTVIAVVTQPDRPKGRELKPQPPPVKALALGWNIPVLQPERARAEDFIAALKEFRPDLIAVAAFGQILPKSILDLPPYGCLNVHTSLLPKYRGAGPIQWAILNGESETGVTIMKMDVGLDTGDILKQEKTPIFPEDNAQTLHDRLAEMGARLLADTIPPYVRGEIRPTPQPVEGVSHAPKIRKADGALDWSRTAHDCWNRVRGLVPWPGAFTCLPTGGEFLTVKIWQAHPEAGSGTAGEVLQADKSGVLVACGEGALRLTQLQREGGRRLSAADFLAGCRLAKGVRLIQPSSNGVGAG